MIRCNMIIMIIIKRSCNYFTNAYPSCTYHAMYSYVHCLACDPVLILVKPAPIGCPIKCLSLSLSLGIKPQHGKQGHSCQMTSFNSLVPGRIGSIFKSVIPEHLSRIKLMNTPCEIVLKWMPQNTCDDKLTLVHGMVWCHQPRSQYMSEC